MMTDVAAVKWAVFDLLKVLDPLHDGLYHERFRRIAQDLGYGCTKTWRTRAMNDGPKWATFALLKTLDSFYAGELHDEFAAISSMLNLELPVLPPEDAANGEQESQQDRILSFLSAQTGPVTLARIIAELGANRWTVNSTLHRLLKKGNVEHVGRDAWKIAAPAPS
jgi:hypothetical protein